MTAPAGGSALGASTAPATGTDAPTPAPDPGNQPSDATTVIHPVLGYIGYVRPQGNGRHSSHDAKGNYLKSHPTKEAAKAHVKRVAEKKVNLSAVDSLKTAVQKLDGPVELSWAKFDAMRRRGGSAYAGPGEEALRDGADAVAASKRAFEAAPGNLSGASAKDLSNVAALHRAAAQAHSYAADSFLLDAHQSAPMLAGEHMRAADNHRENAAHFDQLAAQRKS